MSNAKIVRFPEDLVVGNSKAREFAASDSSLFCDSLLGQAGDGFIGDSCVEEEIFSGSDSKDMPESSDIVMPNSTLSGRQNLNSQVFSLSLDNFDGPIDLLLHLVKRNELPIEKLSLAKVADQFFNCIKQAIGFDLELAGEYLVIAANLLSIKAALLLDPKADQRIEVDEGPNPHDELLRRLREAEVYQEAARLMAAKNILGIDVFAASVASSVAKHEQAEDPGLANHDSCLLAKAINRILASIPSPVGISINWNRISIGERMQFFMENLKKRPGEMVSFEDLIGDEKTLPVLVSSFVALLELCKRRLIRIKQHGYNDLISLCLISADDGEEVLPASYAQSEFDLLREDDNLAQVGNIS